MQAAVSRVDSPSHSRASQGNWHKLCPPIPQCGTSFRETVHLQGAESHTQESGVSSPSHSITGSSQHDVLISPRKAG